MQRTGCNVGVDVKSNKHKTYDKLPNILVYSNVGVDVRHGKYIVFTRKNTISGLTHVLFL